MNELVFHENVERARRDNANVIFFIFPEQYSKYHLYFVRDILDTNLDDYNYEEVKGIGHYLVELKDGKFKCSPVSIDAQSLAYIIEKTVIIDFDTNSKCLVDRFMTYMSYFIKFATDPDLYLFLYLYAESMYNQRKVAKQLDISINDLYNRTSIAEIRPLSKKGTLMKSESLKYNYIGMVYANVYTFDVFLQLYHHPNIDVLLSGITSPIVGNLLVAILFADSSDQVISQYLNFKSDFITRITIH